jgi:hypothetical protein
MTTTGSLTDVLALFLIGCAGVALGLLGLVFQSQLSPRRWLPPALSRFPNSPWITLLTSGLLLCLLATCQSENLSDAGPATADAIMPAFQLVEPPVDPLTTDRGRTVRVFTVPDFTPVLTEREGKFIAAHQLTKAIKPIGHEASNSNCHGWTFAAGRFWIMDEDVDAILADNGYQLVAFPRVGDLAVYRNHVGQVAHTGIIRLANPETQQVQIESKFTILGCFLHRPEQTPYEAQYSYYHSDRTGGHILQGLLSRVEQNPSSEAIW